MIRRKLFVGISVDGATAMRLKRKLEPFLHLPVLWTPKENMHITLLFLGHVDDDRLPEIVNGLYEACAGVQQFDVELSKISLGGDADRPKTIWAEGGENEELRDLQGKIEKSLGTLTRKKNVFRPHVTLGRIKRTKWSQLKEKPEILVDIRFSVPVSDVTLFESLAEDGERRYLSVEVVGLG